MARISGVDLPRDKRGEVAIQYIYGIGIPSAKKIFADARVDPGKRVKAWSDEETARTGELLQSLAGKHSLVVVEHDMHFVESIARKVTVLHEGRLLAEGTLDVVREDPRVIDVYLGR